MHSHVRTLTYALSGAFNREHLTVLELLEQCLSEPLFDQLRSKQQLGYSVSCGVRQTFGMLGIFIPFIRSLFAHFCLLNFICIRFSTTCMPYPCTLPLTTYTLFERSSMLFIAAQGSASGLCRPLIQLKIFRTPSSASWTQYPLSCTCSLQRHSRTT